MRTQRVKTGKRSVLGTLKKMRERKRMRDALKGILGTQDGKVFFEIFLRHCHVTRSKFSSDPYKIVEEESLRRLAMSYLALLGDDNLEFLLGQLERENQTQE